MDVICNGILSLPVISVYCNPFRSVFRSDKHTSCYSRNAGFISDRYRADQFLEGLSCVVFSPSEQICRVRVLRRVPSGQSAEQEIPPFAAPESSVGFSQKPTIRLL